MSNKVLPFKPRRRPPTDLTAVQLQQRLAALLSAAETITARIDTLTELQEQNRESIGMIVRCLDEAGLLE